MKKITGYTVLFSLLMMSCTHHTYTVKDNSITDSSRWVVIENQNNSNMTQTPQIRVKFPEVRNDKRNYLPDATAFRMSGDYSNNVAITISPDGILIYFPDPQDITADSEPISLGEGWWLNNQGLGPNSVFTKYTFAEYAALPQVPSIEELKKSILPGAKVTDFIELPMKIGEASNNLQAVKDYLKGK